MLYVINEWYLVLLEICLSSKYRLYIYICIYIYIYSCQGTRGPGAPGPRPLILAWDPCCQNLGGPRNP